MCTMSASNLGTADMATFMVNSLYMMKTTLALFEFTDKRLEMLQFQIEAHLDTLINEQASYVLTRAGLSYIYNSLQQHKPEQAQFDRYLSAPDSLLMSQLNFLLSATVKEQIIKQSTELVCRAYSELYAAVMDPSNEYKDPETILHRSPHQVQALLS
ncbi:PREDICTED: conserved oligomeric Golgi complex subunit 6 isoform X2 [Haliaeetus leucocephalus]|nr:PREDICTED: conserved oligomeric Golgi complex subunit 6 isoform X2 [Haliaeetus leucocephalus]